MGLKPREKGEKSKVGKKRVTKKCFGKQGANKWLLNKNKSLEKRVSEEEDKRYHEAAKETQVLPKIQSREGDVYM